MIELNKLYNTDSIDEMVASRHAFKVPKRINQTNDSGILLARHLTAVNPKVLNFKYPDLVFSELGLTLDNTGGYAQRIQTLRLKASGKFGPEGSDRGKINIDAEDTLLKVSVREAVVDWSHRKIKEAELGNYNVVDRSMAAALTVYNQEIDTAALTGVENKGLLNNTSYTTTAASSTFASLTPAQMFSFIADEITAQHTSVNNTTEYSANFCILPISVSNLAERTLLNTYTNQTVLTVLKNTFPSVTFVQTGKADVVGSGNVKVMSLFSNSKEAVAFRIPVPLQFSPVQQQHWDFSTVGKYHQGGLDVLEGKSGRIVTGL